MLLYFGADHKGFELKERLKGFVKNLGYEWEDMSPTSVQDDDYPDASLAVARKVAEDPTTRRGILLCGSGAGVDIAANKVKGIRSVLGFTPDQVYDARHDDDVNVLSLPAGHLTPETAEQIVRIFIGTPFSGEERHTRRIKKIAAIEN